MTNDESRYAAGLKIRREVVGDEYVDRSLAEADEFSEPMQRLVTEYCWGTIWARDDLDRRTRSLLNVAMLALMNRPQELRMHVMGALRNGCTQEEIRETLLQVAVYCGVPVAIDGFRIAKAAIAEVNAPTTAP